MNKSEVHKEYHSNFDKFLNCSSKLNSFLFAEFIKRYPGSPPFTSWRTKSVNSLAIKIEQDSKVVNSILEIHDIIGLRIICLSESVVVDVITYIKSILNIERSFDTYTRLDEDQFGYSSIHLIGRITTEDNEKIDIENPEKYIDLLYEIQVRTFAQHIFAELSHKYSYKSGAFLPSSIKRPLFRIAALSEVIDNEINMFEREREKSINSSSTLEDEIDVEKLRRHLEEKFKRTAINNVGEEFQQLAKDLKHFNIKTLNDLNSLIDKHYEEFLKLESKRLKEMVDELGEGFDSIQQYIRAGYIYSLTGAVRGILEIEFKATWDNYREENIAKPFREALIELSEKMIEKGK